VENDSNVEHGVKMLKLIKSIILNRIKYEYLDYNLCSWWG